MKARTKARAVDHPGRGEPSHRVCRVHADEGPVPAGRRHVHTQLRQALAEQPVMGEGRGHDRHPAGRDRTGQVLRHRSGQLIVPAIELDNVAVRACRDGAEPVRHEPTA